MHHSFYRRLLPFLRRDFRARLSWACATLLLLVGLTGLGVAALTKTDSPDAQRLRVSLGLEDPHAVCGGFDGPECLYGDWAEEEAKSERLERSRLRVALLDELSRRVEEGHADLERLEQTPAGEWSHRGLELADLSPLPVRSVQARRSALLSAALAGVCENGAAPSFDGIGWVKCTSGLAREVTKQKEELFAASAMLAQLRARETAFPETPGTERQSIMLAPTTQLLSAARGDHGHSAAGRAASTLLDWISEREAVAQSLARAIEHANQDELELMAGAVTSSNAELWANGFSAPTSAIPVTAVRYRSPVTLEDSARLFAIGLLGLSALVLLVVGPSVTATSAARERENGTLPVLRMTGLSPGDLAWAMIAGPNVYAWTVGIGLLVFAMASQLLGGQPNEAITAAGLLLLVSGMTHATALGLGFAASRKLPAWTLGATAAALLGAGGLVGSLWLLSGLGHTGLLLGPIPVVFEQTMEIWSPRSASTPLASTLFAYTLGAQALVAALCLLSWRRRVEQSWMPSFRPFEGLIFGALAVGCGALTTIDLSAAANVTAYDEVNLIVAIAAIFTVPVIGWALASSLVRPARSAIGISLVEARRAFGRFQLLLVGASLALAASYTFVVGQSQLSAEPSQTMWLTLAHGLLVAETMAASLLLAARNPGSRHRILILGGIVSAAQAAFTASAYHQEREFVALGQGAWAAVRDASGYWLVFLVLLWAAGLGLVLAALLRERDRKEAEEAADAADDTDDEEGGGKPTRWLH